MVTSNIPNWSKFHFASDGTVIRQSIFWSDRSIDYDQIDLIRPRGPYLRGALFFQTGLGGGLIRGGPYLRGALIDHIRYIYLQNTPLKDKFSILFKNKVHVQNKNRLTFLSLFHYHSLILCNVFFLFRLRSCASSANRSANQFKLLPVL